MHPQEAEDWKEEVLGEIFRSLAGHPPLHAMLVFKGARVLNERLHELGRRSLDIDSNLFQSFVDAVPEPALRQESLERELWTAMSRHFDAQSPVRYSVERIRIEPQPPAEHPRGWDGYDVRISVSDLARRDVRGLPSLTLDIAAPEQLREDSIAPLTMGAATVLAYTLERIAGEKLRAFLSSLPEYRAKMNRRGEIVRAKDVFDLARIARVRPVTNRQFWLRAGDEFRLACESRFIDCRGIESFEQDLATTESSYRNDATIPNEPGFHEAWPAICEIVAFLEANGIVPFECPVD